MGKNQLANSLLSNSRTLGILIILLLASRLSSQTYVSHVSKRATTAGAILEIPVSARALALGNAFAANGGDGSAFYWNPAAPARTDRTSLYALYMPWLADTRYNHFAVIVPAGSGWVAGASVTTWGMDDMIVRTEDYQEGTGEKFDAGDLVLAVSVARALTDRYSIGFTAKYIQERIWHSSASTVALDFGTLFKADIGKGVNIAAVISNYGGDMRLAGRDPRTTVDPDPVVDGNNSSIPANYELDAWPLPLFFRFGLATDLIRSDFLTVTVEVDAIHPSNNYPSFDSGIEVSIAGNTFLRAGYSGLGMEDTIEGISLGAGVQIYFSSRNRVSIDYGFKDFGPFGYLQALSLDISL